MSERRPQEGKEPRTGDELYEFEWPDDAKEMRAAEREEQAKQALVRPAPRVLSALVLGIATVMLFILVVSVVGGAVTLLIQVAAVVVAGAVLFALPVAWMLDRVSRGWPRGLPELAFTVLGIATGAGWTWVFLSVFPGTLADDQGAFEQFRTYSAVFMGTAVATAFVLTRAVLESFRRVPKAVYAVAAILAVLTLMSITSLFTLAG